MQSARWRRFLRCCATAIALTAGCAPERSTLPTSRASLFDLVQALPENAPTVVAIDAVQLKRSPLAVHIWSRLANLPFALSIFSEHCMDATESTKLLAIAASSDFSRVVAINAGLSRADVERCRSAAEYQQLLSRLHIELRIAGRYEALASSTHALQMLWMGPQLVVLTTGPTNDQLPANTLQVIGERTRTPGIHGPLDEPGAHDQLQTLGIDRSAPIWGFARNRERIEVGFSIKVDDALEFRARIATGNREAADSFAHMLQDALQRGREQQLYDVGFARADDSGVTITVRMSEQEVWSWLAKNLRLVE